MRGRFVHGWLANYSVELLDDEVLFPIRILLISLSFAFPNCYQLLIQYVALLSHGGRIKIH